MKASNARAALAAVVAEGFLGRLAFGMLSFAFPLYARSLGLSLTEIGVLISLRSIVVLPLKPVAGWLADLWGIRAVYLLALFMRTVSAVWMLLAGDFLSLAGVRLLHGVSAAGRDVGSLGVVVRDAENHVGTAYSWYATAKHLGSVAGAGLAGLIIAAAGGTYNALWVTILVLSILPMAAAWYGLREAPAEEAGNQTEVPAHARDGAPVAPGWFAGTGALMREIAGPAMVGMLVAASAYMIHGIFPVLATEYAGLTTAQAGWIYTLSAVVYVVAGPVFGWLSDRYGRVIGMAARSAANIGSSVLYLVSPTFAGFLAARAVDDAGKAAFKPAWASAIADVAKGDERQRGRRIGALDTAETAGEVIGPALAGFLWQSGGIVALFGVRIAIAIAAELTAMKVFGEVRFHPRPSPTRTAVSYLAPPALALAGVAVWLGAILRSGGTPALVADGAVSIGIMLLGVLAGAWAGGVAARTERQAISNAVEAQLSDLRHDVRRSLTVVRGEVELILTQEDTPLADRQASGASVIEEVERIDELLRHHDIDVTQPPKDRAAPAVGTPVTTTSQ